MDGRNLIKFCIHFIIDKIYVAIVGRHFLQICNGVTALDWYQKLVLHNILRKDGQNLTKFCIHIVIDKIYISIVKRFFRKCSTELRPLIDVRNWFLLNILRMDGQNLIKFCIHYIIDKIYVCVEKGHFLQICNRVTALDLCQKLFFCSIAWEWMDRILTKFCIHITIDKVSRSGLVLYIFFFFSFLQQSYSPWLISKLVFAQYLENGWTEFYQILYTHFLWQDLCS